MTIIRHHIDIYWNWIWSHMYDNHRSSHWLYSNIPVIQFQHTWFANCQSVESMGTVFGMYVCMSFYVCTPKLHWLSVIVQITSTLEPFVTHLTIIAEMQIVLEQSSKSTVFITIWFYIEGVWKLRFVQVLNAFLHILQ